MKNKYNSRKLYITLLLIITSFTVIMFKFNDDNFIQYFKQWSFMSIAIFSIYTGGNVGQKFSRKNNNNQD